MHTLLCVGGGYQSSQMDSELPSQPLHWTVFQTRIISFHYFADYNFYIASILSSLECVEFIGRFSMIYFLCAD